MNEEHPLRDLICPVCGRAMLNHYYMTRGKQSIVCDTGTKKVKKYKTYKDPDSLIAYYDYISKIYDMHRDYIAVEGQGGRAGLSMMTQITKDEWQHGFDLIQYAVARAIKWWINMDWTSCETICGIINNFNKIQTPVDNPSYIDNFDNRELMNLGEISPITYTPTAKPIPKTTAKANTKQDLLNKIQLLKKQRDDLQRAIYRQDDTNISLSNRISSMEEAISNSEPSKISKESEHKNPITINYKLIKKMKDDRLLKSAAIATAEENAGIFAPIPQLKEMYSAEKVEMILKARKLFLKIAESAENIQAAVNSGAINKETASKMLTELRYHKQKQAYKYKSKKETEPNNQQLTAAKKSITQEIPLISFLLPKSNLQKLYPKQPETVDNMLELHELYKVVSQNENGIRLAMTSGIITKDIAKLFRLAAKAEARLQTISIETPPVTQNEPVKTSVEEFNKLHPELLNKDDDNII